MDSKQIIKRSKLLSLVLRHRPEKLGLTLDSGGWVDVDTLLKACKQRNIQLSRAMLDIVVRDNNKQRFSYSEDGLRIRANQGHSIEVDLGLSPTTPPTILYHGTAHFNVSSIQEQGLLKQNRQYVHLSADTETALNVGQRHGRPVLFTVQAEKMHEAGYAFYISDNGVWLTDTVPPAFLELD